MSRQNIGSFRPPTILCAFHPNETIEHFCHSKQCMLPLCRVCISIHQKQHKSMVSTPSLIQISSLMENINQQIEYQKLDISKSHIQKKFYRILSEKHQEALRRAQETRDKLIQDTNRRFNLAVSQMCSLYEQKLLEARTIHMKLQVLDNTLDQVTATFNKKKPMRTVILWESKELGVFGNQILASIGDKINLQQNQQIINNRQIIEGMNENIASENKVQIAQNQIRSLNNYLEILGSIIEKQVDTSPSSQIKKSFIKLRTSGISLTEVSIIKSEAKRSRDSQILSTPERQNNNKIRLVQLGRDAKLSGRALAKQ